MTAVFTDNFKAIKTENGFCFRFYCDLCSFFVETPEFAGNSYELSLAKANDFARRYFNMCHSCGRWICDGHYNEDEMNCVICSPLKRSR